MAVLPSICVFFVMVFWIPLGTGSHEVMGSNSMPVRIAHGELTMASVRLTSFNDV